MGRLIALLLCALCGCAKVSVTHGVPNLRCVDAQRNVWRSGQPSQEGMYFIAQLGVTNVIKLNVSSEGKDLPIMGQCVRGYPIGWTAQVGLRRLPYDLTAIARSVQPGTLIHCTHGEDRTGVVSALYRLEQQHWTKAQAEHEMLALGFHRSLCGLWHYWRDYYVCQWCDHVHYGQSATCTMNTCNALWEVTYFCPDGCQGANRGVFK